MTTTGSNLGVVYGFVPQYDGWSDAMNAALASIDAAAPSVYLAAPHIGGVGDGSTDNAAAFALAEAALPEDGGTIFLGEGAYAIAQNVTFTKSVRIRGIKYIPHEGLTAPSSIVKKNTGSSYTAITFAGEGSSIEDVVLTGVAGNSGSGIEFTATRPSARNLLVYRMGSHGIVIGGPGSTANLNLWYLDRVVCRGNGGDGVFIEAHDGSGPGANAGTAILLSCQENAGAGLRLVAGSKNTFIGLHTEDNTSYGIVIGDGTSNGNADRNTFIGGDQEGNNSDGVQIDIAGTSTGDNVFVNVGSTKGTVPTSEDSFQEQSVDCRTVWISSSLFRLGTGNNGQIWHNGPKGGQAASGVYTSLYADSVERLRFMIGNGTPATATTALFYYDASADRLWILPRSNSAGVNAKIRIGAGKSDATYPYLELDDATDTATFTACDVDLGTAGKGYKVAGTKVVGAQGALIADASGGATVDTEARAAINALLARLRTHGLIAT